ncbi:hypothetical protein MHSN_00335 [Metamycoplasma hyosynoviae]|uniref:Uncharacterized protein n=1 Tax=Metamycoplasma hyosynoviae TaxID=29559 RepID=A0A4P1QFQ2_9BACT|nr:hypothetical protein MHSN_00335 [Metamycoplasma hyosynoviae]
MENYSKYRNKTYKFIDKFSHFKLVKCLLLFHIFAMLKKQKKCESIFKKRKKSKHWFCEKTNVLV